MPIEKPRRLDPLADRILSLLSGRTGAGEIVLGDYLALQHYVDHRTTHDIDAWWSVRAAPGAEQAIRDVMRQVADEQRTIVRERRFGDTVSFELIEDGRPRFSFQIAVRSITVEEPQASAWPPLRIETLADNVGSKMNALVNRGAPRDFLDIHAVVAAGLLAPARCGALRHVKNPDGEIETAKRNVLLHLANLEARRPLDGIDDPAARAQAQRVRQWFADAFVRG